MLSSLFLAVQGPESANPLITTLPPFLFMIAVFYFLIIRPNQKRQSEHKKFISGLEKNQEVVTEGGIHGTVVGVKDGTVTLRVAENVRIEVDRSAISRSKAKS